MYSPVGRPSSSARQFKRAGCANGQQLLPPLFASVLDVLTSAPSRDSCVGSRGLNICSIRPGSRWVESFGPGVRDGAGRSRSSSAASFTLAEASFTAAPAFVTLLDRWLYLTSSSSSSSSMSYAILSSPLSLLVTISSLPELSSWSAMLCLLIRSEVVLPGPDYVSAYPRFN